MNLPEKPPTHGNTQTSFFRQTDSATKWRYAKSFWRLALPIVLVGTVLCAPIESPVLAKNGPQGGAKESAIDPDAMTALDKMGAYLRTVKAFQVKADVSDDDVMDDGQIIQFSKKVDIVAARPDRMRIEVDGDEGHRFFFFDGKNFTIYAQIAAPDKTRLDIKGEHYFRDRPEGRDEVASAIAGWIAPRRG